MLLLEIVWISFDVVMFTFRLRVYLTSLSMCVVTMAPRFLRMRTEGLPVDGEVSCECTEWPLADSL